MTRRVVAGHAALVAVQVCFGLLPVFGTLAFMPGGFSPLGVGSWRIAGGAAILGALAFIAHGRRALPERRDLPLLVVCGLLGVALNQGLFLIGLDRSTPMNAGLVMTLIPVFTFVIAAAAGQESFSLARGVGVLIAMAGAALLLVGQGGGLFAGYGFGNLLMALNGLSYATYLVISKRLVSRYPPLVVISWVYIFALFYLPYFAAGEKLVADPGAASAWLSLVYIIVFPTTLAYLLNMFALERVRATTTAVYIYAQPIVAGVASWIVFSERPGGSMVVAGLCLFAGIWLVARRSSDTEPAVQAPGNESAARG